MIDLHYWPTPNGKKVTILLEECGLPYKIVPVNIGRGDQFTDAFLEMNPNHRMPVMVDHEPKDGGKPIAIFESGAIMMYIAEKAGKFYPQDLRTRYDVNQWLIWQMANQGPKSGECGHFRRVDQKHANGLKTSGVTQRSPATLRAPTARRCLASSSTAAHQSTLPRANCMCATSTIRHRHVSSCRRIASRICCDWRTTPPTADTQALVILDSSSSALCGGRRSHHSRRRERYCCLP